MTEDRQESLATLLSRLREYRPRHQAELLTVAHLTLCISCGY
jgi:hypothetical protein